ncbi:hypothetical protein [Ralstonia phage RSP15]|uniref:hypothetical protein n=1 Tax=Ralstonia phage RSP15 TaxID=1785960 RepID=UPI00074D3311|nr:hypothetical protein BH754_gp166 [Ralstonia phage RSP15]BAU40140.1 hypothetical protein [Ralstonia phage RSP15]
MTYAELKEEAERVMGHLDTPDFNVCVDACTLIHKLLQQIKGPEGYDTWYDAAVAERLRRVQAEEEARKARGALSCAMWKPAV